MKKLLGSTWFDLGIILLVGLLPLTWMRGQLIAGQDLPFPLLNPQQVLDNSLSSWASLGGTGSSSPEVRSLVYALVDAGLARLGLDALAREGLLLVFCFAGAGLSAYFLTRLLSVGRVAAVAAGLFYMLNPYTMAVRWYELNVWQFFYALAPALLALFILGLRRRQMRYSLAFVAVYLFASPAFGNLGAVLMLGMLLGGYLAYYLIRNPGHTPQALLYVFQLGFLWVGLNLWWIIPSLYVLPSEGALRGPQFNEVKLVNGSVQSTLDRVLSLQGYAPFFGNYGPEEPILTYAWAYKSPWLSGLGWLIPALAVVAAVRRRRDHLIPFLAALWLVSTLFMTGLQPPLGGLTRWLHDTFPLVMAVFRSPFDKFGMLAVVGLAPLVGVGIESLGHLASLMWRRGGQGRPLLKAGVVGLAGFLLLGVLVWPFWTGEVIYEGGKVMPSFRVTVPPEYEQARSWLQGQPEEFRILPLPFNRTLWSPPFSTWYQGHDPLRWLLGRPIMASPIYQGGELVEAAVKDLLSSPQPELEQALALWNVKYILLRADANYAHLARTAWERDYHLFLPLDEAREVLAKQEWLELEARFGALEFYRNRAWRPSVAYAASEWLPVDSEGLSYRTLANVLSSSAPRLIISEADVAGLGLDETLLRPGSAAPTYTADQLARWLAQVEVRSEGPFFVVLSQAFNSGWRAYSGSPNWLQVLFSLGESSGQHFVANGYANGWYFDQPGEYELTLYYWPQTLFYLGLTGSAGASLLLALVWVLRRRASLKKANTL